MRVDVVLPFKDCAALLPATLDSILAQSHQNWRAFLLDHGSTDDSLAIAQRFARRDPRVSVIDGRHCATLSELRNFGLSIVESPIAVFSDADDISLPHRFAALIRAHDQYPDSAVIGSNAWVINHDGVRVGHMSVPSSPAALRTLLYFRTPVFQPAASLKVSTLRGSSAQFGGLFIGNGDAKYNPRSTAAEDYLFYAQIGLMAEIRNVEDRLIEYRWHSGNMSSRKRGAQLLNAAHISNLVETVEREIRPGAVFTPEFFSNHGNRLLHLDCAINIDEEYSRLCVGLAARVTSSDAVTRELSFRRVLSTRSRAVMTSRFGSHVLRWGRRDDEWKTVGAFLVKRLS